MDAYRQPNSREMAKKAKVRKMAESDRAHLLLRQPFIGALNMRMDIIPVCDSRLTTAATDGTDIFLDNDFYLRLGPEERVFLLAHEVWHCVLLHFNRRHNRVHEPWNIAADLEIQFILAHENMKNPCPLPCKSGWWDYNAEEIYDKLPKMSSRGNAIDKHLDKDSDDCTGDPRKIPGTASAKQVKDGEDDAAQGTGAGNAPAQAPKAGKGKGGYAAADQEQPGDAKGTVIAPDYSPSGVQVHRRTPGTGRGPRDFLHRRGGPRACECAAKPGVVAADRRLHAARVMGHRGQARVATLGSAGAAGEQGAGAMLC